MKFNQLGTTGIFLSELCLGTMTFGGKGFWKTIGQTPQDEANALVKNSLDAGVNFIDTANVYSEGLSETMLGKALKDLGVDRQQVFVATKVLIRMGTGANQVGLSRGHIQDSVNDSLDRLGLDHIDLLYIHGVDPVTSLEETLQGLEDVVRAGKVRYLGVSNHPAWSVMKAQAIARGRGTTHFVAGQYYYSLAGRDIEREIIPMAQDQNIGIMPWSPLAGGFLSGKFTRDNPKAGDSRRDDFDFPPVDREKTYDIIDRMQSIAGGHQVSCARVALAWLLRKPAVCSVIIGARNKEQLEDNLKATELSLSDEELEQLDEVSALPLHYPRWMMDRQAEKRFPGDGNPSE